jgi:MFS family permease
VGALRDPRFRRLLIGNSISSFGDSALYLTLGIWAKDLTGSNAAAGAIFLAQGLPYLAAPLAGHLVDRVKRRPLLITTNAGCALVVLALLTVHTRAQLWVMYAVAFGYGLAGIIIAAAGAGLLKDLLADDDLATANAASTTISQGLRIVSPLVGAALYAGFGGGSVAVFDTATFTLAIGALLTIHVTEHETHADPASAVRSQLLAGIVHLRRSALLAQITLTAAAAMLVLGFYESVTFAVIAAIGRPPAFFGVLMAIQAVGSIAGGLVVTRVIRRIGEARTLGVSLIAWTVASLLYIAPTLATACVALTIFGAAIPLCAVAVATATQRHTSPALQGRVNTASGTAINLSQTLSIAVGAALINTVDYRLLLATAALVLSVTATPILLHPAQPDAEPTTRVDPAAAEKPAEPSKAAGGY